MSLDEMVESYIYLYFTYDLCMELNNQETSLFGHQSQINDKKVVNTIPGYKWHCFWIQVFFIILQISIQGLDNFIYMEINNLERQRTKLYRDHLKNQAIKESQYRKYQNSYNAKKNNRYDNGLIEQMDFRDQQRLALRKNNAIMLKQHNSGMNAQKQSGSLPSHLFQNQRKKESFEDHIHNMDHFRINKIKKDLRSQNLQNSQQEQMQRYFRQQQKYMDQYESLNHLRTNQQIQEDSIRNYEEIKRKHEQDMDLYKFYQDKLNQDQSHKKQAQQFTEAEKDFINPLYRNQSSIRRKYNQGNQEILREQMKQFQRRKSLELSGIKQGHDLQKSIFRNILHHDSYDRKQYADYLKSQIENEHQKKSGERNRLKQRTFVEGVYGGQHTHDRKYQLDYIDNKMGLRNVPIIKNNSKKPPQLPQAPYLYQSKMNLPQRHLSFLNNTSELDKTPQISHPQQKSASPQMEPKNKDKSEVDFDVLEADPEYNPEEYRDNNIKIEESKAQAQGQVKNHNKRYFKNFNLVTNQNKLYDFYGI